MKVVSIATLVAEKYSRQYPENVMLCDGRWTDNTLARLRSLPSTATNADVDKIVGNNSWRVLIECDQCKTSTNIATEVCDGKVRICPSCLYAASGMIENCDKDSVDQDVSFHHLENLLHGMSRLRHENSRLNEDAYRIGWLSTHRIRSEWNCDEGHVVTTDSGVVGVGQTFRDAVDSVRVGLEGKGRAESFEGTSLLRLEEAMGRQPEQPPVRAYQRPEADHGTGG